MGTDIHTVVQVRKGDKWVTVANEVAADRNYQLFAILADVRNGYGFAGCITGDVVKPIDEPRGLPNGFELDGSDEHEGYWMGEHSRSWFLLSELNEYAVENSEKTVSKTGFITFQHYLELRERGSGAQPNEWCGGISGVGINISQAKEAILNNTLPADLGRFYIRYDWIVSLVESSFLNEMIKEIEEAVGDVVGDVDPDNVRLVFGFDS